MAQGEALTATGAAHFSPGKQAPLMQTRYELACQLMQELVIIRVPGEVLDHHQYSDYCRIAEAVERGERLADILQMTEAKRWPKALTWLKERLSPRLRAAVSSL
jgi:hypothetical protein